MELQQIEYRGYQLLLINGIPGWVDTVSLEDSILGWVMLRFTNEASVRVQGLYSSWSRHSVVKNLYSPHDQWLLQEYKYERLTVLGFLDSFPELEVYYKKLPEDCKQFVVGLDMKGRQRELFAAAKLLDNLSKL